MYYDPTSILSIHHTGYANRISQYVDTTDPAPCTPHYPALTSTMKNAALCSIQTNIPQPHLGLPPLPAAAPPPPVPTPIRSSLVLSLVVSPTAPLPAAFPPVEDPTPELEPYLGKAPTPDRGLSPGRGLSSSLGSRGGPLRVVRRAGERLVVKLCK